MRKQLSTFIEADLFDRLDKVCKETKLKKINAVEIALKNFIIKKEKEIAKN